MSRGKSTAEKAKGWQRYDVGSPSEVSKEVLAGAVRRAAKAANQRLVRLEQAGLQGSYIYKDIMSELGLLGRRRFKERPDRLTLNQLRHEYLILREFIMAKTSTVKGQRSTDRKRYETAVSRGFKGTEDEFYLAVYSLFTQKVEKYYSSKVIYEAIQMNDGDELTAIIEEAERLGKSPDWTLIERLRRKKKGG